MRFALSYWYGRGGHRNAAVSGFCLLVTYSRTPHDSKSQLGACAFPAAWKKRVKRAIRIGTTHRCVPALIEGLEQ